MGAYRGKPFGLSHKLLAGFSLVCCLAAPAWAGTPAEIASLRTQLVVEYLKQGNVQEALNSADAAVKADPSYMPGHLMRAQVLQLLKLNYEAEASFKQALSLAPKNPEANNNYGWFLCSTDRATEALPYFEKALADPLYTTPQTALANWGMCAAKLGRREEANEHYLAALRIAPNFPLALKELARLQLEQGNARLASFYFQRLLRVAPLVAPEDLMLGVKVAHQAGDRSLETLLTDQLKLRFPDSKETQLLLIGS
jgi:type IV pilus assembly protein PilF